MDRPEGSRGFAVSRYDYDKNGNLSKVVRPNQYDPAADDGAGYQYTYDHQGRVLTVVGPNSHVLQTNTYDGAGRSLRMIWRATAPVSRPAVGPPRSWPMTPVAILWVWWTATETAHSTAWTHECLKPVEVSKLQNPIEEPGGANLWKTNNIQPFPS